jgi:T5orf172 domain
MQRQHQMVDLSDDELLAQLGVERKIESRSSYTPVEERLLAGFEEIQAFVDANGRPPLHGEGRDIFERLFAVRLDRIRRLSGMRQLLTAFDRHKLLDDVQSEINEIEKTLADDELLSELGIDDEGDDITTLTHVKTRAEKRAAEAIANREPCRDFDDFKKLFQQIQDELKNGVRVSKPYTKDIGISKADITKGQFFILGGQIAYVADVGEEFRAPYGDVDARLRVIYSNATESNILRRSLQRALYKDEAGRRISEPAAGPLFGNTVDENDTESGTIYVLRSKSDHPTIASNRDIIHKIGVTNGKVESRIANAMNDATFLLAEVEIVARYELYNINRVKLENLLHRFFANARLDIQITDRFGKPVKPQEWFLVPLTVIDEAVKALQEGSISQLRYDLDTATLVSIKSQKGE